MAWAERMSSGRYRGCWRDSDGETQTIVQPNGRGFERKTDAKEAAQVEEVKANRRAAVETGKQSAKITWGNWWDLIDEKRLKAAASDTKKIEKWVIEKYIRPKWGNTPLNKIKKAEIQEWVDDDLTPGKKPTYVRTIYSPFSVSLNKAVEKEILDVSPCVGVKLPTPKKRRQKVHMTASDRDKLAPHLNDRYLDMVDFQLDTGLRPGELCGLHADQLDLEAGWMAVTNVLVDMLRVIRPWPKDLEERHIPLTSAAIRIIQRGLDGRDLRAGCGVPHSDGSKCRSVLVFLSPTNQRVLPSTYRAGLTRAADKAGVPNCSPYTIRRAFGTRAADAGTDAFTIAAFMGHSNLEETNGYVQRTEAARAKFLAGMGEVAPLTVVGQSGDRVADRGAKSPGMASDDRGPGDAETGS